MEEITLDDLQCLRQKLGVYFLYTRNDELVYIGQSKNMYQRILEHIVDNRKDFSYFKAVELSAITFMEVLEVSLISSHKPYYNSLIIDDFSDWFKTLPTVCKKEMAQEQCLQSYNTNSLLEIGELLYKDIISTNKNNLVCREDKVGF